MLKILHFILGSTIIMLSSLMISENPKKIRVRFIIQILIIEIICSYCLLNTYIGIVLINNCSLLFSKLLIFATEGINFVFGGMNQAKLAFFFLNILCPIIFISSLIGILQYTKILSFFITIIGYALSKINGMGKLESFNAISSLILGQSENFIAYKDILENIPKHRIYSMAVTAMSTVSMSIVCIYMTMLTPKYVITAIILNMFSTFIILSLSNPYSIKETDNIHIQYHHGNQNFFDILQEYIYSGFKIAVIIAAMLIGFISLINAANILSKTLFHITLQDILSYVFLPFAWMIGIPNHENLQAARIMATKLISNEFVAIIELQKISNHLSTKTTGILSVFLVSFANFSSIGIIIGALKGLSEKQAKIISHYGFKLVYCATLANLLSANIAGLLI